MALSVKIKGWLLRSAGMGRPNWCLRIASHLGAFASDLLDEHFHFDAKDDGRLDCHWHEVVPAGYGGAICCLVRLLDWPPNAPAADEVRVGACIGHRRIMC